MAKDPNFFISYTLFTAGEAERITGVSAATQRDWRRRGYLTVHNRRTDAHGKAAWNRYDVHGLAELLTMRILQERGMGPSDTRGIAAGVADAIMHHALCCMSAIDDQTKSLERLARERKAPLGTLFVRPTASYRFWVEWANSTTGGPALDLDGHFLDPSNPKLQGAIIVLDLKALGLLLVESTDKYLVTVMPHAEDGADDAASA
jgi:hypothetical protein